MATAKIKLEVVMEYERGEDWDPYQDGDAAWALVDSHCKGNIVTELARLNELDNERHVCNICQYAKVTLLPEDTEAYHELPDPEAC